MRVFRSVGLALILLPAGPASAESAGPLPRQLAIGQDACFGATLPKSAKGRLATLTLFHDHRGDPQVEDRDVVGEKLTEIERSNEGLRLHAYVRLKDRPGRIYRQTLHCPAEDGGARCGVDCDGGGFRLAPDGEKLVLTSETGLIVRGGCSTPDTAKTEVLQNSELKGPIGLAPLPIEQCIAERSAWRPVWAADLPPIADRLAAGTPCFARDYDKAHLARHPRQTVASIALHRLPVEGRLYPEQFDLRLAVKLKNGRSVAKTGRCSVEDYSFSCVLDSSESEEDAFLVTRAPDGKIAIRDEHALLPRMLGLPLGADDRTFLLDEVPQSACPK